MVPRIIYFVQKILLKRVWIVVLIFILFIVAKGTWEMYQKAQFAKNNRDSAVSKLQNATKRERLLREELVKMDSPRGVETAIRQTFDVGRKGEKMIVLVDAPVKEEKPTPKQPTIWERITSFLRIK